MDQFFSMFRNTNSNNGDSEGAGLRKKRGHPLTAGAPGIGAGSARIWRSAATKQRTNRRHRSRGASPYKNRGRMHVATKSILVVIIAMLTASLAILPGAERFNAMAAATHGVLDPEPCHAWMWHCTGSCGEEDPALGNRADEEGEASPDNQMSHG